MAVPSHAQSAVAQPMAAPSPLDRWHDLIAEASHRFGIPEAWIRAVMRAESGGQTVLDGRPITSRAGAMGLMQIMPDTWAELRTRYGLGNDPYDPHDNIFSGTAYLRELYVRYGYPNMFAAYNAGPARFDAHLFNGQPLPDETLAYLATLGQPTFEPVKSPQTQSGAHLFFSLHGIANTASNPPAMSSSGGLFMPLATASERKP
ncbi:MAG TPA: lytic transglycosylase domain-containing protein [Rhodopila sp.]|nr:lytic transglycosylase domain-containing protein [Rhodopila sp.]